MNGFLKEIYGKKNKYNKNSAVVQSKEKNDNIWNSSQFKYMVLFSEDVSSKEISEYYNVTYDTVKKYLQAVSEKYGKDKVEDCINVFKERYSETKTYKNIFNTYLQSVNKDKLNHTSRNNSKVNDIEFNKFIEELKNNDISYIDNSSKSDILWVIYNKNNETKIVEILKKYQYSYSLEKRGSIITNNQPAWRVMIK